MPSRTTKGLNLGSKVPLRGFTQLLQHLDPGTRAQLESAFSDAENMIDYHSRTVPERQTKRKFSGTIQQPQLTTESTIVGAFVKWDRLSDKRIGFYEIQIDDSDFFPDPEIYSTVETFFVLENVVTTRFVRIRGVRQNGESGLWSEVARIRPTITAPDALSVEFYPGYADDSYPTVGGGTRRYSGGDRYIDSAFYTILSETFYADRRNGAFSAWGMMTNRLAEMVDANVVPWDRVRFKVNGIAVQDGYFPLWTNMQDEDAYLAANENDHHADGSLMSFYAQGGYTASFGPYAVSIPNTLAGDGPRDPGRIINLDSSPWSRGRFYWTEGDSAKHPSFWSQAQFADPATSADGISGNSDPGTTLNPQHEAQSVQLTEDQKTEFLWFHNFKFDIPPERLISGIRVEVSRRQPSIEQRVVTQDLGGAAVNRPLNDSRNYDGAEDNVTWVEWTSDDILDDVDFGEYLPINDRFDRLRTVVDEDVVGVVNAFTLSVWVNFSHDDQADNCLLAAFGEDNQQNHCRLQRGSAPNFDDDLLVRLKGETGNVYNENHNSVFPNLDEWYHIAVTKDNLNVVKVYINGALNAASTTSGGPLQDFIDTDRGINVGAAGFGAGSAPKGGIGQCGIWNTDLKATDIERIYDLRMEGDYRQLGSRLNLVHYYLAFPKQGDTQDHMVLLTERSATGGVRVRDDLDNKAKTEESWPQLSEFFNTTIRQYDYLPLGDSNGIPHDNHNAIGYQDYGGEADLWGESLGAWSPAIVNDFYFGFIMQAINNPTIAANASAFVDHGMLTVYHVPEEDRSFTVAVEVAVANEFYIEREAFGAAFNVIEMGEQEAIDYVRCQAKT